MINSINKYSPKTNFGQIQKKQKPQNMTFSGIKQPKIDEFLFNIADSTPMRKIINWASGKTVKTTKKGEEIISKNYDKLTQILLIGFSAILQTTHIINIMKNKEMPQERKETLAVNNALAFVIPTIGALTIDNSINRATNKIEKYIKKVNNNKLPEKTLNGIKAAKSIFVITMMYKYAATIITTPMADVTTDWLRKKDLLGKTEKK